MDVILMKKIVAIGMLVIFLISSILVPATAMKTQITKNSTMRSLTGNTQLQLKIVSYRRAIIKNVGDEDAYNIDCEIAYKGLKTGLAYVDKWIEKIEAGEEREVYVHGFIFWFGFGPLVMKVTVSADNAEKVTKSRLVGFMLGPLFFPI